VREPDAGGEARHPRANDRDVVVRGGVHRDDIAFAVGAESGSLTTDFTDSTDWSQGC
jgi:hypothetical protein